jgi:hypothetical protein
MLRMEVRSIADKMERRGPPRAKNLPSGAINALNEKHVKMTQVYKRADMTRAGFTSHTVSINGPVDNPVHKANPFRYKNLNPPSSLP